MKQLSSFMVMNVAGGVRVSYTYDEIDEQSGELTSSNNKGNFFVVDKSIKAKIEEIQDWIHEKKLSSE